MDRKTIAANPRPGKHKTSILIGLSVLAAILAGDALNAVLTIRKADVVLLDKAGILPPCDTQRVFDNNVPFVQGHFCAVVYTSLGLFAITPENAWNPFADSRKDLITRLKEGCTYRIWFNGTGKMPSPEVRATNRVFKTIFRATQVGDCPSKVAE